MSLENNNLTAEGLAWVERKASLHRRLFEKAQELVVQIDPHLRVEAVKDGIRFYYIDGQELPVNKITWTQGINGLLEKTEPQIEAFFANDLRSMITSQLQAKKDKPDISARKSIPVRGLYK